LGRKVQSGPFPAPLGARRGRAGKMPDHTEDASKNISRRAERAERSRN
jgi:hypothetical protein